MLLVPQTPADASRVLLLCFGFPVLSFRSWSCSIMFMFCCIMFCLSHLLRRRHDTSFFILFERSEFLIPTWVTPQYRATSPPQNMCVCSTNLGFSGGSANRYCCRTLRQYDTRYVLCTRYVCTWYQPAEIYTCVRYVFVFVSPFCFSTAPPHFW